MNPLGGRALVAGSLSCLLLFAAPAWAQVGSPEGPSPTKAFLEGIRQATLRFQNQAEAIRAGYRRLGPDFPGMGEHWVHPGRVVRGEVDPLAPPVLNYATRQGRPHLVGLAYALPMRPGQAPPSEPFDREAWHDHHGVVDEESLLIAHPRSMHGVDDGYRLAMVHVWTGLDNPDGILAQNNWALPFWREGLRVVRVPSHAAARGVSLASGLEFYTRLLRTAADLSTEEEAALDDVLARSVARAREAVEVLRRSGGCAGGACPAELEMFEDIWTELWSAVRAAVHPHSWERLAPLSGGDVAGSHLALP